MRPPDHGSTHGRDRDATPTPPCGSDRRAATEGSSEEVASASVLQVRGRYYGTLGRRPGCRTLSTVRDGERPKRERSAPANRPTKSEGPCLRLHSRLRSARRNPDLVEGLPSVGASSAGGPEDVARAELPVVPDRSFATRYPKPNREYSSPAPSKNRGSSARSIRLAQNPTPGSAANAAASAASQPGSAMVSLLIMATISPRASSRPRLTAEQKPLFSVSSTTRTHSNVERTRSLVVSPDASSTTITSYEVHMSALPGRRGTSRAPANPCNWESPRSRWASKNSGRSGSARA